MDTPSRIGRYEILEELGRGAMGMVYRAKDPSMDRIVAIKTIIAVALKSEQESEFRERFYREARAAGGLAHPGIVPVFDVGEHEGVPFLVMEFISGRTLADTIKKGERLSPERACEIGQRIAEALGYAHQRGVIHRDIKPANILLTSKEAYGIERPKITDFGVAKLAEARTTMTGQLLGTPAFMPPEQFTGGPIDGRADIFALGVVLYWMATGEQPFPGDSITAVSYKVVHTEPVPPRKLNPWIPARLEAVIMKCLAKSPDERYQTGEELAQDLAKIREQGKVTPAKAPAAEAAFAAAAGADPGATMSATAMASAPTMAMHPPAGAVQAQAPVLKPPKSKSSPLLVVAGAAAVILIAGGWYVLHLRQKAAITAGTSPAIEKPSAPTEPPVPALSPAATPESAKPAVSASSSETPATKKSQIPPAAASNTTAATSAKKTDIKVDAKNAAGPTPKAQPAAPTPKAAAANPLPAAVDFDPKTLDPKQNAKLRIDSKRMPAGVDFSVEMNGKLYLHKTSAGSDAPDDELFVPPGVQEFRVTARSGAVQKSSNTVSAEFKAKKKMTLKIELRNQGAAPDSGIPQGIYQDTQIVIVLK
jgi:eukaryotic-like serine/threonine-protein kinase